MIVYLRSLVVGIVAAVLASVLWLLVTIGLAVMDFSRRVQGGAGGVDAVSVGLTGSTPVVALVAFAAGFYWHLRRATRSRQVGSRK